MICGLLAFRSIRQTEIDTAVLVGLRSRSNIEVAERYLFRVLRREVPQRLANNGVVVNLFFTLIAEDKNRSRDNFGRVRIGALTLRWRRAGVEILIALLAHLLIFQTLLVHLIGVSAIVVVVLIVRQARVGIPPPVGIVKAVTPGI